MSLILEALKKSEAERQRGQAPTVFTPVLQESFERKSSMKIWLPWLLLGILALIVAMTWWWTSTNKPEIQSDAARAISAEQAPRIVQPSTEPAPAENSSVVAPVVKPIVDTKPAAVEPAPTAIEEKPALATSVMPIATTPITPDVEQDDALPLSMLGSEQRKQLPAMKYSMHVFGETSNDRFAIIDGNRVTQGSTLGPAVVVEIRRDGVVIEWDGSRYLVAKP